MWRSYIYEILGARGGEYCGPAWHSQYRDSEQSGDQLLVGVRYSIPIQTSPGAHPASYTTCTRLFPRVKRLGLGVDHPPPLALKLKRVELYSPSRHSRWWILRLVLWDMISGTKKAKEAVSSETHVPTIRLWCHIPEETTNNIT